MQILHLHSIVAHVVYTHHILFFYFVLNQLHKKKLIIEVIQSRSNSEIIKKNWNMRICYYIKF